MPPVDPRQALLEAAANRAVAAYDPFRARPQAAPRRDYSSMPMLSAALPSRSASMGLPDLGGSSLEEVARKAMGAPAPVGADLGEPEIRALALRDLESLRSFPRTISPEVEALAEAARQAGHEAYARNPTVDRTIWSSGFGSEPRLPADAKREREKALREAVSAKFDAKAAAGDFFGGATLQPGILAPGQSRFVKAERPRTGPQGAAVGSPEERAVLNDAAWNAGLVAKFNNGKFAGYGPAQSRSQTPEEQDAILASRARRREEMESRRKNIALRKMGLQSAELPGMNPTDLLAMRNPEMAVELQKIRSQMETDRNQREMMRAVAQMDADAKKYSADKEYDAAIKTAELNGGKNSVQDMAMLLAAVGQIPGNTMSPSDMLRAAADVSQGRLPEVAAPPVDTLGGLVTAETGRQMRKMVESDVDKQYVVEALKRAGVSGDNLNLAMQLLYNSKWITADRPYGVGPFRWGPPSSRERAMMNIPQAPRLQ